MRLRISCSAYAYACCQVSTSSLAAAWGSSALQTALTTKKPSTPVALSCGKSAVLTPPPTTMGTGLAAWSAARSSKLLVMIEPSAARPQSRLVSVSWSGPMPGSRPAHVGGLDVFEHLLATGRKATMASGPSSLRQTSTGMSLWPTCTPSTAMPCSRAASTQSRRSSINRRPDRSCRPVRLPARRRRSAQ